MNELLLSEKEELQDKEMLKLVKMIPDYNSLKAKCAGKTIKEMVSIINGALNESLLKVRDFELSTEN